MDIPPVEISQRHVPADADEAKHLAVDLLAPYRHICQGAVPALVAVAYHQPDRVHGLLGGEALAAVLGEVDDV